jgi:hypothetical protein
MVSSGDGDPSWPNVTPYVVMIDAKGNLQKVLGPPSPEMLRRWLYYLMFTSMRVSCAQI